MPIDVRMPKLSDNMEEGIIIRWMKAPGDRVVKGEPLAEVETDKADVELEASDSGTLHEIKIAEGQSAAVGAVIAVLADGEAATQPSPDKQSRAAGAAAAAEPTKDAAKRRSRNARTPMNRMVSPVVERVEPPPRPPCSGRHLVCFAYTARKTNHHARQTQTILEPSPDAVCG